MGLGIAVLQSPFQLYHHKILSLSEKFHFPRFSKELSINNF